MRAGVLQPRNYNKEYLASCIDWERAEIEKKVIRIQDALQKLGRDEVDAVGFNEIIPEIYRQSLYKTKLPH